MSRCAQLLNAFDPSASQSPLVRLAAIVIGIVLLVNATMMGLGALGRLSDRPTRVGRRLMSLRRRWTSFRRSTAAAWSLAFCLGSVALACWRSRGGARSAGLRGGAGGGWRID